MSNYTSVFKRKEAGLSLTSNMTGKDTEAESPSFIPGTRAEIKKMKIKFYILLLISNLVIFFAMNSRAKNDQPLRSQEVQLRDHANHTKVKLPLRLHLEIPQNTVEVPITLYVKGSTQVIERGYLHAQKTSDATQRDLLEDREAPLFEVEIPNQDLMKVVSFDGEPLSAYPYNPKQVTKKLTQSRMPYEIHF